jgi:hypothetical protein
MVFEKNLLSAHDSPNATASCNHQNTQLTNKAQPPSQIFELYTEIDVNLNQSTVWPRPKAH